jgi:hypothetical protein
MLQAFFPAAQREPRKENRWLRQERRNTRTSDRFLWESANEDLQILLLGCCSNKTAPHSCCH